MDSLLFRYSQLFHIFKLLHRMCDFEAFNVRHTDSSNTLFPVFVTIYLDRDWDWVYPSFYASTCSNCCDYNLLPRIINHNDGTHTAHTLTHNTHLCCLRFSFSPSLSPSLLRKSVFRFFVFAFAFLFPLFLLIYPVIHYRVGLQQNNLFACVY